MPSFMAIRLLVPEKIFEGLFTIYGRGGGHLGSCDPDAVNKLSFPLFQGGSTQNLALIRQALSDEKIFENG